MIRYGITHVNRQGLRTLSAPAAQGRWLNDTRAEVKKQVKNIEAVNSRDTLVSIFGLQALGTFKVQEIDCWDNGDPKGTVFPD